MRFRQVYEDLLETLCLEKINEGSSFLILPDSQMAVGNIVSLEQNRKELILLPPPPHTHTP